MPGIVIGLTGGIASGKSTVANILKEKGIPVVDADIIAREVVEKGSETLNKLVETFSPAILHNDGSLDRAALGSIIFHNEDKRQLLNSIIHPNIRKRMKEKTAQYLQEGYSVVVMDIPLLFESKLTHLVDKTIVVYVDEEVQLKRLMERNILSKDEALARIHSQMPLKEKKNLANFVIDNNGSLDETTTQLQEILKQIQE
ncbi:dephospho-CoA kinase [Sutcliffiella sp. NC1]|uniref:dephospho-CoA kinase n=1 Tax=Sutcliffiella sp. NC1 TaxID=3004096 RepID=UPI0022DDDA88|nr:dephospho-CoA kinase [Sutcliffiella sp. NC1]WBL14076.1 dephospho-CoA kinase [Sutcliffiella sp. NC1]